MELVSEEELTKVVTNAIERYKQERTPEKLAEEVITKLKDSENQILAKLLGMQSRWGKWEIDHCNGRKSSITEYIEEHVRDVLHVWMEQLGIKPDYIPPMTAAFKREMIAAYRNEYEDRMRRSVRELAVQAADAKVKEVIAKLLEIPEPLLDDSDA